MSNAVTRMSPAGGAVVVPEPPAEAGAAVRVEMDTVAERGPSWYALSAPAVPEADFAEAKAVLQGLDAACMSGAEAASNPAAVSTWLLRLSSGAGGNPPSEEAFARLRGAVLLASGDLPAQCFNLDTLRLALREVKFLSAPNVDAIVRPAGQRMLSQRRALRAIVDRQTQLRAKPATSRNTVAENLTVEERERVLADFRAKMAAASVQGPAASPQAAQRAIVDPPIPQTLAEKIVSARQRLERAKLGGMQAMVDYLAKALADLEARQAAGEV